MNIFTTKTLLSGPRHIILAVYMRSDGVSGDLDGQTLIDPVDFGLPAKSRLRLVKLEYCFAGFDACLEYDSGGIDANFKWVLAGDSNVPVDFSLSGNLIDDSGLDGTGVLRISTTGFTADTDQGSILLKVRKP